MASNTSPTRTTSSREGSSSPQHRSSSVFVYKGKTTNRSWQQLPPEIIRLIATQYILDVSTTSYCPQVWEARENWHSRIVYAILRDANEVEKLMRICPSWHTALETHLFWHQACTVFDPYDTLAYHTVVLPSLPTHTTASAVPSLHYRMPPYRHFRNMTNCSCYVCRINSPHHNAGLAVAKRPVLTPFLGTVFVCREHRRNSFCGLCLREAPPLECANDYNLVSCVENEDHESWPGVDATCRACRSEWLWRRTASNPKDREAVGGPKWNSPDWETRQSIEAFIDMGEGTISDVVSLAQEKHWLRCHTKLPDMLSQALAASRYASREEGFNSRTGYLSDDELSDDDGEDEDDPELMSLTEDAGGVRELAISDWARNRILDGHWFSPADQWYGNSVPNRSTVVRAVHPCPWTRHINEDCKSVDGEEIHPRSATVRAEVPPTFQLCEQAYVAYQKQIRLLLLPAMTNIVRRLVIECQADATDPALRASRMHPEDVICELRNEAVWYNGIDWLERRANGRREASSRNREEDRKEKERDDGDDSSTSSKSGGSHTTSPVLSTSTLQTTPSPPPSVTKKDDEQSAPGGAGRVTAIPVSPTLPSPVLIHPIPHVPVTASHLPHYSLEALKMVWREACAPLYHCRCQICERAMVSANRANFVPRQAGVQTHYPVHAQVTSRPVEIKINAATPADLDGEDEVDDDDEESGSGEEDFELSVEELAGRSVEKGIDVQVTRCLKRSSREFDDDTVRDSTYLDGTRVGTPPKRARIESRSSSSPTISSPGLLKKRGSEELQDNMDSEVVKKKPKVDNESSDGLPSPPTSMNGAESVPSTGDTEPEDKAEVRLASLRRKPDSSNVSKPRSLHQHLMPNPAPLVMREADLDQLYSFEAEVDI